MDFAHYNKVLVWYKQIVTIALHQFHAVDTCACTYQVRALTHGKFATLRALTNVRRDIMFNQKFFDELSAKLGEAVANSPAKDIEKNMRALLAQGFAKLDLVTREEFDVQTAVLARTREQLTALEVRVTALEAHLVNQKTPFATD